MAAFRSNCIICWCRRVLQFFVINKSCLAAELSDLSFKGFNWQLMSDIWSSSSINSSLVKFSIWLLSGNDPYSTTIIQRLALLAFLIILTVLFIRKARCTWNKVVLSPMVMKVIVMVGTECSDVSQVLIMLRDL